MNKLERKIGKYAVPNLMRIVIAVYGFGVLLSYVSPNLLAFMTLEPYYIFRGQIWRLITWVLIPSQSNILFVLIMLYFYYSIGTNLERTWGEFRFNLYMWGGVLFTDIGAIVLYLIMHATTGQPALVGSLFSISYLNMSLFLAFAVTFPEMQILLYFIIPVKMKWMGYVYGALVAYEMLTGNGAVRTAIIASLLNFLVFYLTTRNYKSISPSNIKRKRKFKKEVREAMPKKGVTKHKCAVCGRTELDGDDLVFRFCSKCDGNYEYCQDHLFTHEHVKKK